jgi:hypothetical protein
LGSASQGHGLVFKFSGHWLSAFGAVLLRRPLFRLTGKERRKAFPSQEAYRYRLTWVGADNAQGFIQADTLRQLLRQDTLWWILKGRVEAEWTSTPQSKPHRLRCEEAHLLPQTGLVKAYRSVEVATATGETLETDVLWWDRTSDRLWAPGWVRLHTPKEEVRGRRSRIHF